MIVRLPTKIGIPYRLISWISSGSNETVYLQSLEGERAFIRVDRPGFASLVGDPFQVSVSTVHKVSIWMSALVPPLGHPANRALSNSEYELERRTLRVNVDGTIVFDRPDQTTTVLPMSVRYGEGQQGSEASRTSSHGEILSMVHMPILALSVPVASYGDISMVVMFPVGKVGTSEPLVVTGVPNAGDLLFVSYIGSNRLRFGLDHWGSPVTLSETVYTDLAKPHSIAISMDSLHEDLSKKNGVEVLLDGRAVLTSAREPFESSPDEVEIGTNFIGGSSCGEHFTGKVLSTSRTKFTSP
jgi:hypothetical protein